MVETGKLEVKRKWGVGLWVAGVATLVIVGVVLYRWRNSGFQWKLFFQTFLDVNWTWLGGSVALLLLTYLGRALRWEVMLRPVCPRPDLWRVFSSTVIGFTAVVLLGRAGEVVRPYLIAAKERVPFSSQMAAWLLERILDLLMVLLIFGFALAHMPTGLHLGPGLSWVLRTGGFLVAGIGTACVLFLVVFRNFSEPAQRRILSALTFLPERHYVRIEKMLGAFVQGMQSTRHHGFLALLLVYTALEWLMIVGGYYCVFRAFPATSSFSLIDIAIFVGFVSFGSVVQVPGIGGGVQVAAVLVLTEIFSVPFEAATGLAILIWVLTFATIVPFGLMFGFHEGITWRKFKHLPEDVPPEGYAL